MLVFSFPQCYLCAVGNYEFQVRVYSYSHTNRREWDGDYCDVFSSNPCDNYFLFCLQAYGQSQTSSYCPYGSYLTSSRPIAATSATFDVGSNIFAPGVNNPLVYRGTRWIVSS